MLWTKIRSLATIAVAAGFAVGGAGAYVRGHQGPSPEDAPPPTATAPADPRGSRATPEKDPEAHRKALEAQRLAARKAEALHEIARQKRILAEIALEEYQVVTFPRDLATADGRVKDAKTESARQIDRRDWAERMFEKKYLSLKQKEIEELNLLKAQHALEQAESLLKVLEGFTKPKTIKELQAGIETARADEAAEKAAWERARALEVDLERQGP